MFVAPGLYRRERARLRIRGAATVFFVAGAAFCYLVIRRRRSSSDHTPCPDIKPVLMMDEQLGLVMMMLRPSPSSSSCDGADAVRDDGSGRLQVPQQVPPHAIIVNVIIAAFVPPLGDPFNLAMMALR